MVNCHRYTRLYLDLSHAGRIAQGQEPVQAKRIYTSALQRLVDHANTCRVCVQSFTEFCDSVSNHHNPDNFEEE